MLRTLFLIRGEYGMDFLNEFLTWEVLGSYAGAIAFTTIFVQFTKSWIDKLIKIPTTLYTYIIALIIIMCADLFVGDISLSNTVLNIFNAVLVAIVSSGGNDLLGKLMSSNNK